MHDLAVLRDYISKNRPVTLIGTSPVALDSSRDGLLLMYHADVAQLVERDLAKVEVAGSSPVVRSKRFSGSLAVRG